MSNQPDRDRLVPSAESWYRPTIRHLLYGVALIGASVGAFGLWGMLVGVLLLIAWAYVYSQESRPKGLKEAGIVLVALAFLGLLLGGPRKRIVSTETRCEINLKEIMLALHNYHDTYGSFPPAYTSDSQGRPMHSWRLLILPFVEYSLGPAYGPYDINEPWDSPNNLKLAQEYQPECYRCPSHKSSNPGHTSYFAVVGPRTIWPEDQALRLDAVTDGTEFTLVVIEDPSRSVLWTEPTDIGYEESIRLLSAADRRGPHPTDRLMRGGQTWTNAAFADGLVKNIRRAASRADLAAMLRIDDGPEVSQTAVERSLQVPAEPSVLGTAVRGTAFLLAVLFPLWWVWRYD